MMTARLQRPRIARQNSSNNTDIAIVIQCADGVYMKNRPAIQKNYAKIPKSMPYQQPVITQMSSRFFESLPTLSHAF